FRQARVAITVGATTPTALTVKLLVGSTTESVMVTAESPVADALKVSGAPGGVPGGVVGGVVGGMPNAAPTAPPPPPLAAPQALGSPRFGSGGGAGYVPYPQETATYAAI